MQVGKSLVAATSLATTASTLGLLMSAGACRSTPCLPSECSAYRAGSHRPRHTRCPAFGLFGPCCQHMQGGWRCYAAPCMQLRHLTVWAFGATRLRRPCDRAMWRGQGASVQMCLCTSGSADLLKGRLLDFEPLLCAYVSVCQWGTSLVNCKCD